VKRLAVAAMAVTILASAALAQDLVVRTRIEPATVRIGERARYRGLVIFPSGRATQLQWARPDTSEWLEWGPLRPRLARGHGIDTLIVEARVQAFHPGTMQIPGLRFIDRNRGTEGRLPTARLNVASVLGAADTNASLRPVRGPLSAPWWERIPWLWVVLGLLVLAAIIALIVRLSRRRKPVARPVTAPIARDPALEALARLQALRARRLPEAGQFAEHAFELTRILKWFLEVSTRTPQPGDTTTELSARFEHMPMDGGERRMLIEQLQGWDRVKFAREPWTVAEAQGSETRVEAFIRRRARPAKPPVATASKRAA
jgi:hypothetical protein